MKREVERHRGKPKKNVLRVPELEKKKNSKEEILREIT